MRWVSSVCIAAWPVAIAASLPGSPSPDGASTAGTVRRMGTVLRAPAPGYAEGAPPGFSGGFGEQSCHGCHFEAEVNEKPGQLTIDGVPDRFAAGERYLLTIELSRPGMKMGGFQLAARMESGGMQAGTIAPGPGETERIAVELQSGVQYASQRRPGTALAASDTARWTLVWTAPMATGPVQIHVAANAADNDESIRGDYVYTAVVRSRPE
jgi:hypothetical protein